MKIEDLRTVGVVGAGTMGHGIAHVCAAAGFDTYIYDVNSQRVDAGFEKIRANLEIGVSKSKVTAAERDATLSRISRKTSLDDLKSCDLVIEAIPEKIELKVSLFQSLSNICRPNSIFATNTSSLSVTEIAASAKGSERVIGMHFFNPVHIMKLLEIVRAAQTSDETVEFAKSFGQKIKKELVLVNDAPGFASSRLGIALGMEAIRMVEEGVASAEDIDRAMELGYGHPMGPLKLTDLVGLDVRLKIAEYLYQELGSDTYRPPQLLKKMVRSGHLGKKTKRGFYNY